MKKLISILTVVAVFALASCGGGGGGGGAVVGSNSVAGAASKGPFQTGSTVTAFKLNADGTRSATSTTALVTDNLGTYSLSGISWSGLTEVEITGLYLDENTGNVSATNATMSSIISLPAVGAVVNSTTTNPNIASTVAASVARKAMLAKPLPATSGAQVDTLLQSSSQTTAVALGLPATVGGAPIDLSKLSVTQTADPALGPANRQLLAVSAGLLSAAPTGTGITTLATTLAVDVVQGKALGATAGKTAAIQAGQAAAVASATTIAGNLSAAVTAAGGTADPSLAAKLPASASKVKATSATVLRGLAVVGNTFTVGTQAPAPVTYTIAATGVATGAGNVPANNVIFKLPVADYSNAAGNGPKAAAYSTTLNFSLASTGDTRVINGSLNPVNVRVAAGGQVTVTVPATSVLSYTGTTRAGLAVTGTATNVTAITSAANVISIDASALATQIGIGITAGAYTFDLGITGLNVGLEKPAPAQGISQLLPSSAVGRSITGTLTTI